MRRLLPFALLAMVAQPAFALDLPPGTYRCVINDTWTAVGYVTLDGRYYVGPSWEDTQPAYPYYIDGNDLISFNGPFGAFDVNSAQVFEDSYNGIHFNVLYLSPNGYPQELICVPS